MQPGVVLLVTDMLAGSLYPETVSLRATPGTLTDSAPKETDQSVN